MSLFGGFFRPRGMPSPYLGGIVPPGFPQGQQPHQFLGGAFNQHMPPPMSTPLPPDMAPLPLQRPDQMPVPMQQPMGQGMGPYDTPRRFNGLVGRRFYMP